MLQLMDATGDQYSVLHEREVYLSRTPKGCPQLATIYSTTKGSAWPYETSLVAASFPLLHVYKLKLAQVVSCGNVRSTCELPCDNPEGIVWKKKILLSVEPKLICSTSIASIIKRQHIGKESRFKKCVSMTPSAHLSNILLVHHDVFRYDQA